MFSKLFSWPFCLYTTSFLLKFLAFEIRVPGLSIFGTLQGVLEYGYGSWDEIFADESLGFPDDIGKSHILLYILFTLVLSFDCIVVTKSTVYHLAFTSVRWTHFSCQIVCKAALASNIDDPGYVRNIPV